MMVMVLMRSRLLTCAYAEGRRRKRRKPGGGGGKGGRLIMMSFLALSTPVVACPVFVCCGMVCVGASQYVGDHQINLNSDASMCVRTCVVRRERSFGVVIDTLPDAFCLSLPVFALCLHATHRDSHKEPLQLNLLHTHTDRSGLAIRHHTVRDNHMNVAKSESPPNRLHFLSFH